MQSPHVVSRLLRVRRRGDREERGRGTEINEGRQKAGERKAEGCVHRARGQPPPIKDEMMENNECSMDNSFIKQFRIESFDSFRSGSRKVFLKYVHFEQGFLI